MKYLHSILFLLLAHLSFASEGMWMPMLIEKQIIDELKNDGLKLEAEDIYNVNQACLKDAIVNFGGCTAEMISDEGLILTNHHCGLKYIQALSTVEHNYVDNGYWAMSRNEELYAEGLTVSILEYMKDVTTEILDSVDVHASWASRKATIKKNISLWEDSLSEEGKYQVSIKPFYSGNQYVAFVSTEYDDVRFVGAPPITIGSFGGDTDNWMWPRHGGDFSMFRIYAGQDNQPALYSEDNQPFVPKTSLEISMKGIQPNDFTFVFGYPGSTDLYATSYKLKMLLQETYPVRIGARTVKLDIMNESMESSPGLRLKYQAKSNSVANSWKRWQGEIEGTTRFNAIDKKIALEKELMNWINADESRKEKYGNLLPNYERLYKELTPLTIAQNLLYELFVRNGMETVMLSDIVPPVSGLQDSSVKTNLQALDSRIQKHFKDFDLETDKQLTYALLEYYIQHAPEAYVLDTLKTKKVQKPGGLERYVDNLFSKTNFADSTTLYALFEEPKGKIDKAISKDPATLLKKQLKHMYTDVVGKQLKAINLQIDSLNHLYMQAIAEAFPEKTFPADANSTLRLSYGHVGGVVPKNGITYAFQTTLQGVIEKDNPNIYDYQVPEKLKQLYHDQDFGDYTNADGEVPVCFLASNHTTGGNSGSPVLNAEGQLIGLNFDRMWEGVMSDLYYTPEICRNISVDIRYVLFIIDKFAGAGYLLDEMKIVR